MRAVREDTLHPFNACFATPRRLGPFGSLPQYGFDYWPKEARVIQVDISARRLGLTKEVDVGVCGDAALAAAEITQRLQKKVEEEGESVREEKEFVLSCH